MTDQPQPIDAGDLLHLTDPSKYVTLPVQHEKIWDKYQQSIDWFWSFSEIPIADKADMSKLPEEQRLFIHQTLAFSYLIHHTITNKELFMQLMEQIDIKEASYYLGSQADTNKTHQVMYSMLLDESLTNDDRDHVLRDLVRRPEIKNLLKWFLQNLNSDEQPLTRRLVAFIALQGIVLESIFVLFSWIEKQFPTISLPGLYQSNSRMWRDEKLNLSFSCMLFEYIEEELNNSEASGLIQEVVLLVKNIFSNAIQSSMIGMDCDLISDYIEHTADKVLADLHIPRVFFKESPFDWVIEPEETTEKVKQDLETTQTEEVGFATDTDF